MTKKKYKIAVFSDLKKSASSTLKSAVSLAQMIDGEIELFYVKKPSEIVDRDNQLSAMRTINAQYSETERRIFKMVDSIAKEHHVNINYRFSFGNVKNELAKYMKVEQPDIVVLGKRKPKLLTIMGDCITDFVLKNYKGVVLLAANSNTIEPNTALSMGVLLGDEESLNFTFAEDLMLHTQQPLTSFRITTKLNHLLETKAKEAVTTIDYVFDQGDQALQNISNYLVKSNINLLCVRRESASKSTSNLNSDVNKVVDKMNVSLLLTTNSNYSLN